MTYKISTNVNKAIFRTYDIRGIVGEQLDADTVYTIALAIGSQALSQNQHDVIVARDGRLSGPELVKALIAGVQDSGCNVIDIGQVPTPVLYFATNTLETRTGIMLTASHNPSEYNGIKTVIAGKTLADKDIKQLYQRIVNQDFMNGKGDYREKSIVGDYIAYIKNSTKLNRPLKIVIDCGNAIPGVVAPQLFKQLGCEVIELFCDVDGNFPNHHPDPTVTDNLTDLLVAVKEHKADIGLGFDGDGDRIGVVTDQGDIIYADRLVMLCAIDVLKNYPGATIVYDVKCSSHLEKIIKEHGGNPVMSRTGHSLLKAKMLELGAKLAGEMSGHIFFNDERWFGFDDGLYVACRLLEILSNTKQTSHALFQTIPNSVSTPELKLYLPEERKFSFVDDFIEQSNFENARLITIDGLRVEFEDGWGLLRASHTTPCLILRFEADSDSALKRIQAVFREQIQRVDASAAVPY